MDVNSFQNVSWNNMTTFNQFFQNANLSAMGYLFAGIDFMVFLILFITLTFSFGWQSAILSSSFIGLFLGLLFVYMGLMNYVFLGFFVGLLIAMIMYIVWSDRYN